MSKFNKRYFVVYMRNGFQETASIRSDNEENAKKFIEQTTSGFGGIISIELVESDTND